jgi:hypothetical protein
VKIGLIVILVLVGGAFLLVRSGSFSFYAYSVTEDANGRSQVQCYAGCAADVVQGAKADVSGTASPMVQDALLIVAAGQSKTHEQVAFGLFRLLARAGHLARPSGAALVWRQALPLARAMDKEESLLLDRVRAVDLQASGSELCRQVALRLIARTQGVVREFEIELAQGRPTWGTVTQFNTARKQSARSYLSELRPCIAAAPKHDRAQLADSMLRF